MANLNQCNFIGRVGKPPEIKYLQDGTPVANFSIAVSETWKDKDSGEKKEKTEWVRIVCWRQIAEIVGKYVSKGMLVFVTGKLQTRSWEQDGSTRYITEIVVSTMQMLGDGGQKSEGGGGDRQQSSTSTKKKDDGWYSGTGVPTIPEDDIPF